MQPLIAIFVAIKSGFGSFCGIECGMVVCRNWLSLGWKESFICLECQMGCSFWLSTPFGKGVVNSTGLSIWITYLGLVVGRCERCEVCNQLWLPWISRGLCPSHWSNREGWSKRNSLYFLHSCKRKICQRTYCHTRGSWPEGQSWIGSNGTRCTSYPVRLVYCSSLDNADTLTQYGKHKNSVDFNEAWVCFDSFCTSQYLIHEGAIRKW